MQRQGGEAGGDGEGRGVRPHKGHRVVVRLPEIRVEGVAPLLDAGAGVRMQAQCDAAGLRQALQHARCLLHVAVVQP